MSSTLEDPDWTNSQVLRGDVVDAVSNLKQRIDGDILIPASVRIVRTLMEHDLVDELRLKFFPVVLGAGEPLFGQTDSMRSMRLVDLRILDGDTAFLTYQRLHGAPAIR